jgi:hypothetical protein
MKAHALKISIAANLILVGMVIGLFTVLMLGRPFGFGPPPVMVVEQFMRGVVVKSLPKEKRDLALAALDRRAKTLSETIDSLGLPPGPESPREGPMAKAFLQGTMDQTFVDDWVKVHEAGQQARSAFLGGFFLDLSRILDAPEREAFLVAVDRELGRPSGPPGGPNGSGG